MQKVSITLFLLFLITAITGQSAADPQSPFLWPVKDGEDLILKRGLSSTFSESRGDHFHNGIDVASHNEPIHPMSDGKYLFSLDKKDDPFQPERGAGNLVILEHANDWWSGYYHLNNIQGKRSGDAMKDKTIAYSGNTGYSHGSHLHLFLCRDSGHLCLNPLEFLPPIPDDNPPKIGNLYFFINDTVTEIRPNRKNSIRLTKKYPLFVEVYDVGTKKNSRGGIHELYWRLNDGKLHSLQFSQLALSEQSWKLNNRHNFSDIFFNKKYKIDIPDLLDGENTIYIKAKDFNGNESVENYTLTTTRQY